MVCGCLTAQMILTALHVTVSLKVTNTALEHYHDRGLLGWLEGGMTPTPPPQNVLDKQTGPEQWDIWKCCQH